MNGHGSHALCHTQGQDSTSNQNSTVVGRTQHTDSSDDEPVRTGRRKYSILVPSHAHQQSSDDEEPVISRRRRPVSEPSQLSDRDAKLHQRDTVNMSSSQDQPDSQALHMQASITPSKRKKLRLVSSQALTQRRGFDLDADEDETRSDHHVSEIKPNTQQDSLSVKKEQHAEPQTPIAALVAELELPNYLRHANWLAAHIIEPTVPLVNGTPAPKTGKVFSQLLPEARANDTSRQFTVSFQDTSRYNPVEVAAVTHRAIHDVSMLFSYARHAKIIGAGDADLDLTVSKNEAGMPEGGHLVAESRFRVSER